MLIELQPEDACVDRGLGEGFSNQAEGTGRKGGICVQKQQHLARGVTGSGIHLHRPSPFASHHARLFFGKIDRMVR